jgi:hypothetical protein
MIVTATVLMDPGAWYVKPEWVIVWVTTAYTLVSFLTLLAIGIQGWIMSSTANKQLRAYVTVVSASLTFPTPETPKAQVVIKNSGQTPAYEVENWSNTCVASYPLSQTLPVRLKDTPIANYILGPGMDLSHWIPSKSPLEGMTDVLLGTVQCTLFVYGVVTYKDIFGVKHTTKFRMIYGGPENPSRNVANNDTNIYSLMPDIAGNEAT